MELNGLPLHPLIVHAAVVLGPIASLLALAYIVPGWRDRLRWPMATLAEMAGAIIWTAYFTGEDFRATAFGDAQGEFGDELDTHQNFAETLRLVASAFAAAAIVAAWMHRRSGLLRASLTLLLVATAIANLVFVFLTGEAGTRAVYG